MSLIFWHLEGNLLGVGALTVDLVVLLQGVQWPSSGVRPAFNAFRLRSSSAFSPT